MHILVQAHLLNKTTTKAEKLNFLFSLSSFTFCCETLDNMLTPCHLHELKIT